MNNRLFTKALSLILLVVLTVTATSCSSLLGEKDYKEDVCVSLKDGKGKLIIKEWSWLQGSGAEIYHKVGDETYLIGKTTGADDGYCPFSNGLYSVAVDGDEVHIKWAFNPGDDETLWRENTFQLKSN